MLKQINSRSKNKLIIAVNIFLVAVLMVVAVYAWFSSNANNTIDAYDIEVQANNNLELSFDNATWSGSLNLADLKNKDAETNVLDTMKFVEVTGDGSNFLIPQLTQFNNYAAVNESGTWTTAVANKDYLSFTVYMRSKDPLNVYFGSSSKAVPSSAVVTGAYCGNPSTYATGANSFSKDCIVGALRVAAFKDSTTKKFLWITNPEYHLNNYVNDTTYTMTTDATANTNEDGPPTPASDKPFYWNDSWSHYYYNNTPTHTLTKYNEENNKVYKGSNLPNTETTKPSGDTTLLATLSGTADANGYYSGTAKFNVWVEGCDTEARRALIDGKFNLTIALDSFNIN